MRLTRVNVKYFKNIIDSGSVDIESDVTCFVGKNESGKTAFLEALTRLHPARGNPKFSVADQYPAWLEKRDRLRGENLDEVRPINTMFVLDDKDRSVVEAKFGSGVLASNEISLARDYRGTLRYTLRTSESAAITNLLAQVTLPRHLVSETKKLQDMAALLDFLSRARTRENVSADAKTALANLETEVHRLVGTKGLSAAVWDVLQQRIPKLFYFARYTTLPYSVDISHLLRADEATLSEDELTARSLLRLAAADEAYLLNPDYERRKRELENVANALTADVLKYWSQNPSLRVLPDITQKTIDTPQGRQTVLDEIKFRIWDERHLLSLPFSEHSSGFQWFFSFLAAFSEYEFLETPVIILLDEPALGLHARAQGDFLRFIDERLVKKCQVLYSTHSPFMIQPKNLERVRIVEDRGREEGMQVSADVTTNDPDTLFPLQGALGYDMVQHLFIAPHNLVVEGTSDFTYISVMSDFLAEQGRMALDTRWSIVPVGGADLIPTFVALLGTHLDVTVVVDSQKAGHQRLSRLAAEGYLKQKRIITMGEIIGRKLADIEDLFAAEDYLDLFNRAFGKNISEADLKGDDQIVLQIARQQGIDRFDHGKPAEFLLRQRLELLPKISEETLTNFEKLFARINSTIE